MKKLLAIIAATLSLLGCPALGQVRQSGNVTPTHGTCWITNGVVGDCGTAAIPYLSSIGTVGLGPTICNNSSSNLAGPYFQTCLGSMANGTGGLLSFFGYNGASGNLYANINGTLYEFPFTTGGVQGPVSSTIGDCAIWNNSSGTLLKDLPCANIYGTQSANTVFAGPSSGSAADPSFRALVGPDLASAINATLAVSAGDLGINLSNANTWSAAQTFGSSDLICCGGSATAGIGTVSSAGVINSEQYATLSQGGLGGSQSGATANQVPVFPGSGGAALPTDVSSLFDSVFGSVQGDILYRGSSAWTALPPGTAGQFLETQGSAANPQWASVNQATGYGVLYPHSTQTFNPSSPWIALDPYGNAINCSGTQTQCAQEFVNASIQGGWPGYIYGTGISYTAQTGTLNNTTTVTGLTTAGLTAGIVTGIGIPANTTFTIAGPTSITLSNAATASGSALLAFPVSQRAPLLLNATLQIPPNQDSVLIARNVQFAAEPTVSTGAIQFDSSENSHFDFEGTLITWGPSSLQSACAVTINPRNPTPYDGEFAEQSSEFLFGSIPTTNAYGVLCLVATNGAIGNNTFFSQELWGGGNSPRGLVLDDATNATHIEGNQLFMPYVHGFTDWGLWIASGGGTPAYFIRNFFNINLLPSSTSATCANVNGNLNSIRGSCSNLEAGGLVSTGLIFDTGTSGNHYDWTTSGVTTPKTDNGSNSNGWVN